jgi:hypothetical protein
VVINEFFYDAPSGSDAPEFVELHNPTGSAVDLSGWKFDSGITYLFPNGVSIPAKGYVVVTADPATFQSRYGFTALGPWTGKLSNEGERIRLRNAASQTVDEVTYGGGFPWPTAARGGGSSCELINPSLDNNLPGSWRASGQPVNTGDPQMFVPRVNPSWHYRKGVSEASTPSGAWRQPGFTEDSTWLTGQTSIGYGDNDDNTILADMQGGYTSLYLRRVFNVEAGQIPGRLLLKIRADDGCVVWINGVEIARFHVPSGELAHNSVAEDHEADVANFEEVVLSNAPSFLVPGNNVIAIHALNSNLASSDFSIDAELSEYSGPTASTPTPGSINSVFATSAPPSISDVAHSPRQPTAQAPVTVTARVVDPDGVGSVNLAYQIVNPGSYIRRSDSSYDTNWTSVPMHDDGINGDLSAGDGLYTAVLPGSLQTHRRLVRYRIIAADAGGLSQQVPYADDASPNFAYFVYNGVPNWSGAFDPGSTPVRTFSSPVLNALPIYQIIANRSDVTNSQYDGAYDGARMWGTFVSNGEVFDHIQFYNRGEASTYVSGKNKWRIRFNPAHEFLPFDNWGRPASQTVDTLNLNANASPWAAVHRGMAGMEEALSFRAYELAGVPSPRSTYIHFRVIDNLAETSTSSQFEGGNPSGSNGGDLWGLYLSVEHTDGSFLDERGMEDGNVYKIESSLGDSKHQAAGQPSDGSDWNAFRNGSQASNQAEAWWRANLNLPAFYTFMALNRLLGNVDIRPGFNHIFYHAPDGHWTAIPWDLDMMFIAKFHYSGVVDQNRCLEVPAIALEYRNRAREILDLFTSDAGIAGGQIGQLIDEYSEMVHPKGQSLTWVDLDAAMWNRNPRTPSSGDPQTNHFGNFFRTPYVDSRGGGTWVRTLSTADHAGQVKYLTDYATDTFPSGSTWAVNNGNQYGYGYQYLKSEAADALIPNRPTITYTGPSGFPIDNLRFQTSTFSDPQGPSTFGALQWRIAQISAPGIPLYDPAQPRVYELTDVWRSGEISAFSSQMTIPSDGLQVGRTYRVRVRHRDNTGRWSRWSAPVQFVAASSAVPPSAGTLAISEFMYNPSAPSPAEIGAGFTDAQDFEFIELWNIGSEPLDLSSTAFTTGITFAFPGGTTLTPGARILAVKSIAAFQFRYGNGLAIAGEYSGNLSNGGEQIVLSVGGVPIHDFTYDDSPPWPNEADGGGYSLVLDRPQSLPDYSLAASWRTSRKPGGNPGNSDSITYDEWTAGHPGIGNKSDDPDGDLRTNDDEYAFGGDPTVGDLAHLAMFDIESLTVGGTLAPYLTITFKRQIGTADVDYAIESSTTLETWAANAVKVRSTPNGDGTVTETWRALEPTTNERGFLRVRKLEP